MGIPTILRGNVDASDLVLASAKVLVGNVSGVATAVDLSGDVTVDNVGAVTIASEAVALADLADLARGSIITGQTANNRPTALDAKTSGRILVGDGTDLVSVAVSGDVTLSSAGAVAIGAGKVLSAMVEADLIRYADVQLTNAQMLAVRATPITLVAAPGSNRTTIVHRVLCVCSSAAGAYSETADNLVIEYADGTDILEIETTGFIDQAAVSVRTQAPNFTVFTPIANSAVRIFNNGDVEFGGGNAANTFSVRVWYSVADMIAFT